MRETFDRGIGRVGYEELLREEVLMHFLQEPNSVTVLLFICICKPFPCIFPHFA